MTGAPLDCAFLHHTRRPTLDERALVCRITCPGSPGTSPKEKEGGFIRDSSLVKDGYFRCSMCEGKLSELFWEVKDIFFQVFWNVDENYSDHIDADVYDTK